MYIHLSINSKIVTCAKGGLKNDTKVGRNKRTKQRLQTNIIVTSNVLVLTQVIIATERYGFEFYRSRQQTLSQLAVISHFAMHSGIEWGQWL